MKILLKEKVYITRISRNQITEDNEFLTVDTNDINNVTMSDCKILEMHVDLTH